MKLRKVLAGLGAVGLGTMLPLGKATATYKKNGAALPSTYGDSPVCWLTTALTEGPYYFNPNLVRQDIRYDTTRQIFYPGLQFNMLFSVINLNCIPIPNVLVDVWHCNKDGNYSGYSGQPGGNFSGYDFMRGIQMTDAQGQCTIITSYPGWYNGRATHIHFKVRLTSTTYVTSQFTFPEIISDAVHGTPLYATRGINPTRNANDGVFRNQDLTHLTMACTPNGTTGGYDGTFAIGINAVTSVIDNGPEKPTQFTLRQNYPNPFNPMTTIEYFLPVNTNAKLVVYDVLGREVARLVDADQTAGMHSVVFDATNLGSGFYFYKLIAGGFVATREMLIMK
jgi:protocatechuate 3,4-dioxygenase beta subunit